MDLSEPSAKKSRLKIFQQQWFDKFPEWRAWVKECPSDPSKFFCVACDVSLACGKSEIVRHLKTPKHLDFERSHHLRSCIVSSSVVISENSSFPPVCSPPDPSSLLSSSELDFNDRVKAAEIRFATFVAQNNIALSTASDILKFFQTIGKEPAVLQKMAMGKTKTTRVINNVVSVRESKKVEKVVQTTKFSIFVDETSDNTNDKWMTLMVRYVDPSTLLVNTELLKLIHLDATNGCAERLVKQFIDAMVEKEVPLQQIISLACDNASVMVGRSNSFKARLSKTVPNLLTLSCICHSLALVATHASAAMPSQIHSFVADISSFINNSPKRSAIFSEFQEFYDEHPSKVTRFAATRWLSRQVAISRILDNWQAIKGFLIDQSSENNAAAIGLKAIIDEPMTKAYLLFLQWVLEVFNKINAHFQGNDTLVHQLQPISKKLLTEILQKFMKPALLKPEIFDNGAHEINFGLITNQLDLSEVDIGANCEDYLQIQLKSGVSELIINQVRSNCLKFYVIAAENIRKRLPFDDSFLLNVAVFASESALFEEDRVSSFLKVKNVCDVLGVPVDRSIQTEWHSLYCIDAYLKERWSKLSFDKMWMEICAFTCSNGIVQFPALRLLLGLIRSLPHSNAPAERAFSLIPEIKTKKRNGLCAKTLNSLCVIRSLSKSGKLNPLEMSIDKSYVEMMNSSTLYPEEVKAPQRNVNVHAYDSSDDWRMIEN